MKRVLIILFCIAIVFALTTSTGFSEYKYQGSGFLSDYSKLKPGPESYSDQSGVDYLYEKEGFDLKNYNKVLMDRVVFFFKADAKYKGINPDEMKELADAFHKAFVEALGKEYPIVTEPGPGVLRIRTAITDIVPSKQPLGTITSVLPPSLVYSTAKRLTTGVHAFVGEATLEAEFLDSKTNEQLAATLDRRGAPKVKVFKGMSKWGHVKVVFEEWALMLRQKLDKAHGKPVKGIYEPIKE